jgi:hypothetical protein
MPNNISMVETAWGTVIATVRPQLTPNEMCELSPGACSIVAYLAMRGQRDPFAGVHQHPNSELWVINATIKDDQSGSQLVTGPYVSLPEAITDAARLYAESLPTRPGTPAKEPPRSQPAASPVSAPKPALNSEPKHLDELRRRDQRDVADFGEVHWEQQLLEILRSK